MHTPTTAIATIKPAAITPRYVLLEEEASHLSMSPPQIVVVVTVVAVAEVVELGERNVAARTTPAPTAAAAVSPAADSAATAPRLAFN